MLTCLKCKQRHQGKRKLCESCLAQRECFECSTPIQRSEPLRRKFCSQRCVLAFIGSQPHNKTARALLARTILQTPEVQKKRGLTMRGVPRPSAQGQNHPRWKGGVSRERSKAENQIKHHAWRRQVFERDNFTCQICNIRGSALEAHHVISWGDSETLRFDIANGQTLCVACHLKVHGNQKREDGKKGAQKRWKR